MKSSSVKEYYVGKVNYKDIPNHALDVDDPDYVEEEFTTHASVFINDGTSSEIGREVDGEYIKTADFDTTKFTVGSGPIQKVVGVGEFLLISNNSRLLLFNTYTNQLISGVEFDNKLSHMEFSEYGDYLYIHTRTSATPKAKPMEFLTTITTAKGSSETYRIDTVFPYSLLAKVMSGDIASHHSEIEELLGNDHYSGRYGLDFKVQYIGSSVTHKTFTVEQTPSGLILYTTDTESKLEPVFITNPYIKWFDITETEVLFATDVSLHCHPYTITEEPVTINTDDDMVEKLLLGEEVEVRYGDYSIGDVISVSVDGESGTVFITGPHIQGDQGDDTYATMSWGLGRDVSVHVHEPVLFTQAVTSDIWVGATKDANTMVGKRHDVVAASSTSSRYLSKATEYINDLYVTDSGITIAVDGEGNTIRLVEKVKDGEVSGMIWVACDSLGEIKDVLTEVDV